jgi:hypothetical protein
MLPLLDSCCTTGKLDVRVIERKSVVSFLVHGNQFDAPINSSHISPCKLFVLKEITDFNNGNSQSKVEPIAFEIRNQFIKHLTVVRILVLSAITIDLQPE